MKKIALLTFVLGIVQFGFSQDITDAVRYSEDNIQGTARFRALSGAFGALGGDMSAVSINPAGSSIFNDSHISISTAVNIKNNDVQYYNGFNDSRKTNFDLNQTGAAFVFYNRNPDSKWKKFAFGASYDKIEDYDNNWMARGTSNSSIDNYFLSITQNQAIPFGVLKLQPGEYIEDAYANIGANPNYGYSVQQVFLGYWAGIIDPVNLDDLTNDEETNYMSNIAPADSFNQSYFYNSTGYNGKFSLNFSTQFTDRVYFGINLNSHFINYDKVTQYYETNSHPDALVNNVYFENILSTYGSGFSFQLGSIVKVTQSLRVGLTYNSPTWYRIEEESSQNIDSNYADPEIGYIGDIINVYPAYNLKSPGKFTGSLAYVFGKYGLISFDYSLRDYSSTKFKPSSDPHFSEQNSIINNLLTTASTYKIGGELRLNQLSIRGGYRFEESPYKDSFYQSDLNGYSVGLGYSFGNFNMDLTFDQAQRDSNYRLYSNPGFSNSAFIDNKQSNITFTVGFNL